VLGEAIARTPDQLPILPLCNPAVSQPALTATQQLLQHGQWQPFPSAIINSTLSTAAEVAIATLPLALFYHEAPVALAQHLQQTVGTGYPALLEVGAVALAIGHGLRGQAISKSLLTQLRPSLQGLVGSATASWQGLDRLQIWLDQGITAESLVDSSDPLRDDALLALYCACSTPTDWSLAVRRSLSLGNRSPVLCALTAALAGAYSGITGIPLKWRLPASHPESQTAEGQIDSRVVSSQQVCIWAQQLLATWAGAYQPQTWETATIPAIAAPGLWGARV
jgi:hypothetical protein